MRQLGTAIGMALVLVVLVGCVGPIGTWKFVEIQPASAGEEFGLTSITFHNDGTYEAVVKQGGNERTTRGSYEFDRKAEKLTLRDDAGTTREYGATTCPSCGYLYVSNPGTTREWQATLKRK